MNYGTYGQVVEAFKAVRFSGVSNWAVDSSGLVVIWSQGDCQRFKTVADVQTEAAKYRRHVDAIKIR